MTGRYEFPCGCSFPILEECPEPGVVPLLDFNVEAIPEDCPAAWALLGRGETKGVFQLESPLGRTWTKKLRPTSGEHIGALGAILRPGCLKAVDEEGVSMTLHYCRRKNGEEEVKPYHPAVDQILFPTFNVLCYQEQAMAIAQAVAGFDLQQADMLRKAIGKKQPEEMVKCEKMFLEGAEKAGVIPMEKARELFGWIKESQRYGFNKSHAISYGLTGYDCAYIKAHFPVAFFTSWLYNSRHKKSGGGPQEEIFELVQDARLFDVAVEPPDLRGLQPHFHTDRRTVRFGLTDIKGIGDSQFEKLRLAVQTVEKELLRPARTWTWFEFLTRVSGRFAAGTASRLIESGATRWLGAARRQQLAEFKAWSSLTKKERCWVLARNFDGLLPALKALSLPRKKRPPPVVRRVSKPGNENLVAMLDEEHGRLLAEHNARGTNEIEKKIATNRRRWALATMKVEEPGPEPTGPFGGCFSDARESAVRSEASLLERPPNSLDDSPQWLAYAEEELLGISLTAHKTDSCDLSEVNCSCKEYLAGREGYLILGVEVQEAREVKTRKGKNPGARMGRLVLADASCSLEAVCFPDAWKEYAGLLAEKNTVIVQGEREQNKDYDSLVVKKVWQANQTF